MKLAFFVKRGFCLWAHMRLSFEGFNQMQLIFDMIQCLFFKLSSLITGCLGIYFLHLKICTFPSLQINDRLFYEANVPP
jgi:hypothetical protein